jgi:hypothetical protein
VLLYLVAGEGITMQAYAPLGPQVTGPLPDRRLQRRLNTLVDTFAEQPQRSIPQVTGNRNDMDAAYAFFQNPRVGPEAIVAACLDQTQQQLQGCRRVLAIQDTTDLNYSGLEQTTGLGHTDGPGGRGLKLHSTLAVRDDGLPAGLLTQQFWARDPAHKGRAKDRRQRQATDKESFRWRDHARAARQAVPADTELVLIADREGDIYDWLADDRPAHTHLLVRVAQAHRVVVSGPDGGTGRLAEVVRAAPVLGVHTVQVPRSDDQPTRLAQLSVRGAAMQVLPPRHAKQRRRLRPVPVWVIEAWEENPPAGCTGLCWRLVTTERVETWEEALRALREYLLRWLIERLHYTLKSGCQIEQLQLETAERLANAVAVYSQVAVRVLRLAYQLRVQPQLPATVAFSAEELAVLEGSQGIPGGGRAAGRLQTVAAAVAALARLGGHLGRKGDGPPGVKVLWRGLQCLHDRVLGYRIAHAAPAPVREQARNPIPQDAHASSPDRYP